MEAAIGSKYWANYQDKITLYWQEMPRVQISVQDFHNRAADAEG